MDGVSDIVEQALKLPRDDREVILREIAASLDEEPATRSDQVAEAWTNELRARRDAIASGRVKGLPLAEVIAAGRARLRST